MLQFLIFKLRLLDSDWVWQNFHRSSGSGPFRSSHLERKQWLGKM